MAVTTSARYRFGLPAHVSGGFPSLNGRQFGALESLVTGLGLLAMVLAALVGVLGLIPAGEE